MHHPWEQLVLFNIAGSYFLIVRNSLAHKSRDELQSSRLVQKYTNVFKYISSLCSAILRMLALIAFLVKFYHHHHHHCHHFMYGCFTCIYVCALHVSLVPAEDKIAHRIWSSRLCEFRELSCSPPKEQPELLTPELTLQPD